MTILIALTPLVRDFVLDVDPLGVADMLPVGLRPDVLILGFHVLLLLCTVEL